MRSAGSALVVVAIAACAPSGSDPALTAITPSSGPASLETAVQITGTNFRLPLVADLDNGGFEVAALSATIGGVPLQSVVQRDDATIDAVVPAGLPLGPHDVVVHFGARTAVLEDGYLVAGSTLTSTLKVAPWLGRGTTFAVSMTVTNNGTEQIANVMPSMLAVSGTATASLVGAPSATVSLPGNGIAAFAFTYTADSFGTLTFAGNATGTDVASQDQIASAVTMASAEVVETAVVATDPFGDGSKFAYVTSYQDQIYLGPNDDGTRALRIKPGETMSEKLSFTFTKDTSGNTTSNSTATHTSIGATGCVADTAACGPDNENGRGTFASGTLDGTEWLVLGGGRSAGDLDYVYMTSDTDTTLDFRYVDLGAILGAATRGFSAAYAYNGRLYLGFPDNGGARPYLVALTASPSSPGLDATTANAINLAANDFPGWQAAQIVAIDSMTSFTDSLYVSSVGGIMHSTTMTPRPYNTNPADWAVSTPSSVVFTSKISRPPAKLADIFPADKAFPQMAVYKNRLYVGRNTTTGPQLWACDPMLGIFAERCEQADWFLVAPNSTPDLALTQFDNPALTAISMVVATPQYLYIGFDSASGARVYRTSEAAPFQQSDFASVGAPGLGTATDTRILDGKALTFSTGTSVWVTVGNDANAMKLVVIP